MTDSLWYSSCTRCRGCRFEVTARPFFSVTSGKRGGIDDTFVFLFQLTYNMDMFLFAYRLSNVVKQNFDVVCLQKK